MAEDDETKSDGKICNFGNEFTADDIKTAIIEECSTSSESADETGVEVVHGETLNTLVNLPTLDVPQNSTAVGSVAITESENVHFGNKTYFNGPITIKQYIKQKTGIENKSYVKTESEIITKKESSLSNCNVEKSKYIKIKTWQKIVLSVVGVVLIGVLGSVVFTLYVKSLNDDTAINKSNTHMEAKDKHPLQIIAPEDVLRIVSRSDWLAQPEEGPLDIIQHPIPWVIIAHTATEDCNTQSKCVLRVRLIQSFHIESRGWNDIGYNFLLGGDGSVYVGRGWDYVGAHTKGYNFKSICIAFIGTFNNEPPPRQQVDACLKLIKLGVKLGKLAQDYKILAHRQLIPSLSPGDQIFKLMKNWPHFASNFTNISELYNG